MSAAERPLTTRVLPIKFVADGSSIIDSDGKRTAQVFLTWNSNPIAAEMVKRWNSHDALVAALEEANVSMSIARTLPSVSAEYDFAATIDRVRAALAGASS